MFRLSLTPALPWLTGLLLGLVPADRAIAQLPNPNPPRTPDRPLPPTLPESPPDLPDRLPRPTPTAPADDPEPLQLELTRFDFSGSTVFDRDDFAALNDALQGRLLGVPVGFEDVLEIEAIVGELYRAGCNDEPPDDPDSLQAQLRQINPDGCYLNSGGVLVAGARFDPSTGVVPVQVLEGRVEPEDLNVAIEGGRDRRIRRRLQPALDPLDRNALLDTLQLLQLDPRIDGISAELSQGDRPELAVLNVVARLADPFDLRLTSDNGRAPTVGSFRRSLELEHRNLSGWGDVAQLSYANTAGSHAVDFAYRLPLNRRDGTLRISGGFTDTRVIEEPFDRIDIEGDSRYLELSLRQPLLRTPRREFALGLTASRQDSNSTLLGEGFPLSAGANDDGETRVSAVRLFQEFTQRSSQDVFALRSQLSLGLGAFGATVNGDRPDSEFVAWRGQAQYVRRLARDSLLFLRSDLQLANDALVPLEQFGVGGLRSVRGYRQDALLTDNGLFASAEVRLPILRVAEVDGLLQLTPFLDVGVGWNGGDTPDPDANALVGAGVGLQWQMGDRLSLRLDWGIPLTDVDSDDETLQENGLYFSLEYLPF